MAALLVGERSSGREFGYTFSVLSEQYWHSWRRTTRKRCFIRQTATSSRRFTMSFLSKIRRKPPTWEMAYVYISGGRALLPVISKTDEGIFWQTGPILTAELIPEAIAAALDEICMTGNPRVHHPSPNEFRRSTPVQKELGMRDWKRMAQEGVLAACIWREDVRISVAFSPRVSKDQQEIDFSQKEQFPRDSPMLAIAERILSEWSNRQARAPR
jgi:hypothetical protein